MSEETEKYVDIDRQIASLQNGVMTYYHLFDTVNHCDRFNIGSLAFEVGNALKDNVEDNAEAKELMSDILETLCQLDSCDPHTEPDDCNQLDHFAHIFRLLGRLKDMYDVEDYV